MVADPCFPQCPCSVPEARLPPASAEDGTALGLQCVGVAPGKVQAFGRLEALMDVRDYEGIRWGSGAVAGVERAVHPAIWGCDGLSQRSQVF